MPRVLTIGLSDVPKSSGNVEILKGGLCDPLIDARGAPPLYDFDVIIINPQSYSHFIFGEESEFSGQYDELKRLKNLCHHYDYERIINWDDRYRELAAAAKAGTQIVWCMADPLRQNFFGYRHTTDAYLSKKVVDIVHRAKILMKKSYHLSSKSDAFREYLTEISLSGWRAAIQDGVEGYTSLASTPEGYSLVGQVQADINGWLLTPPTTSQASKLLVLDSLKLPKLKLSNHKYHGIFLYHTNADKSFVRSLRKILLSKKVPSVWVDEAELQIGDKLIDKIQEAIEKHCYIGVVLSPDSVAANWVKAELDMALTREMHEKRTVVLPILYKKCELPLSIRGKLYADFTENDSFLTSTEKLLRRLEQ